MYGDDRNQAGSFQHCERTEQVAVAAQGKPVRLSCHSIMDSAHRTSLRAVDDAMLDTGGSTYRVGCIVRFPRLVLGTTSVLARGFDAKRVFRRAGSVPDLYALFSPRTAVPQHCAQFTDRLSGRQRFADSLFSTGFAPKSRQTPMNTSPEVAKASSEIDFIPNEAPGSCFVREQRDLDMQRAHSAVLISLDRKKARSSTICTEMETELHAIAPEARKESARWARNRSEIDFTWCAACASHPAPHPQRPFPRAVIHFHIAAQRRDSSAVSALQLPAICRHFASPLRLSGTTAPPDRPESLPDSTAIDFRREGAALLAWAPEGVMHFTLPSCCTDGYNHDPYTRNKLHIASFSLELTHKSCLCEASRHAKIAGFICNCAEIDFTQRMIRTRSWSAYSPGHSRQAQGTVKCA